jgi:hypothetical protein
MSQAAECPQTVSTLLTPFHQSVTEISGPPSGIADRPRQKHGCLPDVPHLTDAVFDVHRLPGGFPCREAELVSMSDVCYLTVCTRTVNKQCRTLSSDVKGSSVHYMSEYQDNEQSAWQEYKQLEGQSNVHASNVRRKEVISFVPALRWYWRSFRV